MHLGDHHQVRHHLFRLKFTELNEIYYFMALRSFALSLVTIFVPIYLYNLGYGFGNILKYYILMYLTEMLLEYVTAISIKKWGPKHLMTISLPFLIFHLWQLFSIEKYGWSPLAIGVSAGISLALFWQAYHYDFSRSKHKNTATKEIGRLHIALAILGALAPFVGGLIATKYSVNVLLAIVIVILSLASFVLFRTKDENFRKGKFDIKKINLKEIKKDLLSYAGMGWEATASGQVWPLFLALIVGTYAKIGLVTSLSTIITILVTYWVSKKAKLGKTTNFIKMGSVTNTIISILQVFVETITQAFATNLGRSFAQSLQTSPFDAEYYLHADEESRSEYLYMMETTVDFSRIIFYLILFGLAIYLPVKTVLMAGLLMGAFGSILVPLIPPARCELNMKDAKIKLMPKPIK